MEREFNGSRIHFKCWKNILIPRLQEQFLRNESAMAPEKFKLLKYEHIISSFEARDLEISNMYQPPTQDCLSTTLVQLHFDWLIKKQYAQVENTRNPLDNHCEDGTFEPFDTSLQSKRRFSSEREIRKTKMTEGKPELKE